MHHAEVIRVQFSTGECCDERVMYVLRRDNFEKGEFR